MSLDSQCSSYGAFLPLLVMIQMELMVNIQIPSDKVSFTKHYNTYTLGNCHGCHRLRLWMLEERTKVTNGSLHKIRKLKAGTIDFLQFIQCQCWVEKPGKHLFLIQLSTHYTLLKLTVPILGRKVMTNLDSIFKSRDITLPTKFRLVKAMVFPVVMYGYEEG